MIRYEARYYEQAGAIYAIIVSIDPDGTEKPLMGYSMWFLTMAAARKSTEAFIKGI